MCTIFIALGVSRETPLVIAANRDEFLARPALPMHWWNDASPKMTPVLAGKDVEAGGTWLGVSASGRLSMVTNVRDPRYLGTPFERTRGELPLEWLQSNQSADLFAEWLHNSKERYSGYNLIYGTPNQLAFFSNHNGTHQLLKKGIHGLSNASLNTPWPKVEWGKGEMRRIFNQVDPSNWDDALLHMLENRQAYPADQLPSTGVPSDKERQLSALNVRMQGYGTRVHTVLRVHHNRIFVTEKGENGVREFEFQMVGGT